MDTQTSALATVDPFQAMEREDEQAILDEIKGRAMDALVYDIRQGGQPVTGLSLAGVRETARVMNAKGNARIGISDREPVIVETDDYFEVKVYAQDILNGGGYWGIKRQKKEYGNGNVNQFALEQALAKAQRNALRGLIPEWFVKEMIDAWRKQGKTKELGTRQPTKQPIAQHKVEQSNSDDKREWPGTVKVTVMKAGYAKDTYEVVGMLNKSTLSPTDPEDVILKWAKVYREHRDAGLESDEAASLTNSEMSIPPAS